MLIYTIEVCHTPSFMPSKKLVHYFLKLLVSFQCSYLGLSQFDNKLIKITNFKLGIFTSSFDLCMLLKPKRK
jgi:hypothetical protein